MKKSVIITGASGNLGGAVVKKINTEGYYIYTVDRSVASFPYADVCAKSIDLTDEASVAAYMDVITSEKPDLKAVVLLVGGFAMGDFNQTDGAALQKMYKLNFETAYFVIKPLLPYFEQKGGGQFVLVGTRSAFTPKDAQHMIAYSLSKALIMSLSDIINAYGKDKGITSSVIVPSIIDTPQNRQAMPNADVSKWTTGEAIADTIHYLMTDSGKHLRETVLKMYKEA